MFKKKNPRLKYYMRKCFKTLGDDPLQTAGKRPTIFTPSPLATCNVRCSSKARDTNKPHIYTHLPSTPSCHSHLPLPIQRSRDKPHTYTFLPSTPLCQSYLTLPNHRSGHRQTSQLCTFKIKLSIYRQRLKFAYVNACRLAKSACTQQVSCPGDSSVFRGFPLP